MRSLAGPGNYPRDIGPPRPRPPGPDRTTVPASRVEREEEGPRRGASPRAMLTQAEKIDNLARRVGAVAGREDREAVGLGHGTQVGRPGPIEKLHGGPVEPVHPARGVVGRPVPR